MGCGAFRSEPSLTAVSPTEPGEKVTTNETAEKARVAAEAEACRVGEERANEEAVKRANAALKAEKERQAAERERLAREEEARNAEEAMKAEEERLARENAAEAEAARRAADAEAERLAAEARRVEEERDNEEAVKRANAAVKAEKERQAAERERLAREEEARNAEEAMKVKEERLAREKAAETEAARVAAEAEAERFAEAEKARLIAEEEARLAAEAEEACLAAEAKAAHKRRDSRRRSAHSIDWKSADPSKWSFPEIKFDGSFSCATQPEIEEMKAEISEGLSKLKDNSGQYLGIFYQSDMVDWPSDQQQYRLVHRTRCGFNVKENSAGCFTWVCAKYDALPSEVIVVPDAYTDGMSYGGQALGTPIMPGRGMGVADVPNLQLLQEASPNDIIQGQVGNCWLMSAISVLAEFEGAIEKLFRHDDLSKLPNEKFNTYTVSLYDLTTWELVDVVVDERLCTIPDGSKLQGCLPTLTGELWVCYLEKAVVAHCGGWDAIDGGQPTHAWRFFTGSKDCYTFQKEGNEFKCSGAFNPNTQSWDPLTNSPHGSPGLWPMKWPEVGGGGDMNLKVDKTELFKRMAHWENSTS